MNRHQRQIILPEIGPEGQARIARARILCVGAGGTGSPVLLYLASAGVGSDAPGEIAVIDPDLVTESNLHRQILFTPSDQGQNKAVAAAARLRAIDPSLNVVAHASCFDAEGALEIASRYDLVLDCSDNFETKFLANAVCAKLGIPLVSSSVTQWDGQVAVFEAKRGPCYRCLVPQLPRHAIPNCDVSGVLGPTVGWVGSAQALEALKWIVDHPSIPPLRDCLAIFDGVRLTVEQVRIPKRPDCRTCSIPATEIAIENDPLPEMASVVSAQELSRRLAQGELIQIFDLREAAENAVPGSVHWPYSRFLRDELPSGNGPFVLYCESGRRARHARDLLLDSGLSPVHLLEGGFSSWPGARAKDKVENK